MGENPQDTLKLRCHRRLRLEFHEARMTSDAGRLVCRELDGALGSMVVAATYLRENPGGRNVQHELLPLLRQSVDSPLARDPAMQAMIGPQALV